jgi:dipeptidase E
MTRNIVAIGGEDWENLAESTLSIDQEIVRLAGKERPRFLFLPTAQLGEDIEDQYRSVFAAHYTNLGCETSELYMTEESAPSEAEMAAALRDADIIYIGGGNTARMLMIWQTHGFDKLLLDAWRHGKVMAGVSAGAICWAQSGHSDSISFWSPEKWEYTMVGGFGVIPVVMCPHYDGHGGPEGFEKPRRERFQDTIAVREGMGVGIDNEAALHVVDDTWRVLAAKPGKAAYRVYNINGRVVEEKIEPSEEFRPISELLTVRT